MAWFLCCKHAASITAVYMARLLSGHVNLDVQIFVLFPCFVSVGHEACSCLELIGHFHSCDAHLTFLVFYILNII